MGHSARKPPFGTQLQPPFGTQLRTANVAGHDVIVNLKILRAVLNSRNWLLAVTMQIDMENCRGTQHVAMLQTGIFLLLCRNNKGSFKLSSFFRFSHVKQLTPKI
jgi:hypothetical protein